MRIIAFVAHKGGSGKSTLASSVAVAARQAGERVFIIDMDPLESLLKWGKLRGEKDIPVEAVPTDKLRKTLAVLEKEGITLVVIDTVGADVSVISAAAKVADLCILPARPNAFDLWASEQTRKTLKSLSCEYAFVLNQCPPAQQSARVELGAKTLEALGGLLTPLIAARVDYQEAARHGLGVTELAPSSLAASEMRTLWSSIKRRLARVSKNATTKLAAKASLKQPKTEGVKSEPAKPLASKSIIGKKAPVETAKSVEPEILLTEKKTAGRKVAA